MNVGEIIENALRYPLLDLKKFLIFGIIVLISNLYTDFISSSGNAGIKLILALLGLLLTVVILGYEFRILESKLAGFNEIPELNNWLEMFVDGLRFVIVGIVYVIPLVLILAIGGLFFGLVFGVLGANFSAHSHVMILYIGILILIVILYAIITYPIILMSLANMANDNDKDIGAAFKLSEIFNRISNIGWGNLIIWYIITGIIYLILAILGLAIMGIFTFIHLKIVGQVIYPLFVLSFMLIFIYRSAALFYMLGNPGYLKCNQCGGYYELQKGESPEDFEKCECGGELKHTKKIE